MYGDCALSDFTLTYLLDQTAHDYVTVRVSAQYGLSNPPRTLV